jgi:hypothetical protein
MKCLLREGSAQLCKHQAIRASWVAQLVETVGRGCKDGLRHIFCAGVGGGILLHRLKVASRIVGVSRRDQIVTAFAGIRGKTR